MRSRTSTRGKRPFLPLPCPSLIPTLYISSPHFPLGSHFSLLPGSCREGVWAGSNLDEICFQRKGSVISHVWVSFFEIFIYYLAVLGLHCCAWAFSSCSELGLLSSWGAQPSPFSGFSCCRAWALGQMVFSSRA